MALNHRERILTTLSHKEPDHVPIDIGGSDVTGIHRDAYQHLAHFLGMQEDVPICETFQQVALPDEALLEQFEVDVRPIYPNGPDSWELVLKHTESYTTLIDEWGVEWAMPKAGGLYFDMVKHPLSDVKDASEITRFNRPDGRNPGRFKGLREYAEQVRRSTSAALTMVPVYGGIFESAFWLRGYQQFFEDLGSDPAMVEAVLDMTLEFRLEYWSRALDELGDLIDVIVEYDDLGHGRGLLISPKTYQRYLKPRHNELFTFIKSHSRAAVFLHSCGAIRSIIPDLIETGIDILNPIQVSAVNMGDTKKLKEEFGKDITFWGGGVNTQSVLPTGTPQEVRDEVKRRIEDLAPGGGYVFAAVHNIQPDVPPENILAMWEAWKEYGYY